MTESHSVLSEIKNIVSSKSKVEKLKKGYFHEKKIDMMKKMVIKFNKVMPDEKDNS